MRAKPTRICRSCHQALPRDAFDPRPRPDRPNALHLNCRACRSVRSLRPIPEPIPNPADSSGDSVLIPLTAGKFAIVDVSDVETVSQFRWQSVWTGARWYARRGAGPRGELRHIYLHRWLLGIDEMGLTDGIDGEHENGDGLDNRRCNLRRATRSQNGGNCGPRARNRSGFRGVGWSAKEGKWIASIQCAGVKTRLGAFNDPETAARIYDAKARELFREFAHPNFPDTEAA